MQLWKGFLSSFHLNGHTQGLHPRTQELKLFLFCNLEVSCELKGVKILCSYPVMNNSLTFRILTFPLSFQMLVVFKSAPILKRALKVKHEVLQLYVLKVSFSLTRARSKIPTCSLSPARTTPKIQACSQLLKSSFPFKCVTRMQN